MPADPGTRISDLVKDTRALSLTALNGCPAETYAALPDILERAQALCQYMNEEYPKSLEFIIRQILLAQQKDDVMRISDFLGYELPHILNSFQK
ncbi:MAG TPA: hypothetical protein DCR21_03125 [Succinivibrionaceae bacterium]|nr:hypothetical protein [Succinivibrio sp.]HAR79801.1 hypothetical protein [Succinivibrionaceae bacterium]